MMGGRPRARRGKGRVSAKVHYQARFVYLGPSRSDVILDPFKKDEWKLPPEQKCKFWLVEEKSDGGAGTHILDRGEVLHSPDVSQRIRLVIRDNTFVPVGHMRLFWVDGNLKSKGKFYEDEGLVEVVRPYVSVCLEVKKFRGLRKRPVPIRKKEVFAVLEVEDPPENPKYLRNFVDKLQKLPSWKKEWNNKMGSWVNDNCPKNVCSDAFKEGCREPGVGIKAPELLFRYQDDVTSGCRRFPARLRGTRIKAKLPRTRRKAPISRLYFLFRPPPIGGDNFKIKVSLGRARAKGKPLTMKNWDAPDGTEITELVTQEIVVWRRVYIDMLIRQKSVSENTINWARLKRSYEAAYIELNKPTKNVTFTENDWKGYLEEVYRGWGRKKLRIFNEVKDDEEKCNFRKFFLPQDPRLVLPDDVKTNHVYTAKGLVRQLFQNIIDDKGGGRRINFSDSGTGLHVLLAKDLAGRDTPLTEDLSDKDRDKYASTLKIGGAYQGDKKLWIFDSETSLTRARSFLTLALAHEIGHALFLRHGLTKFQKDVALDNIIDERLRGDVLWDDHDWKEAVPCTMSYYNEKSWRFCGMCLLTLRFYDRVEVAANRDVRHDLLSPDKPITIRDGGKDGKKYSKLPESPEQPPTLDDSYFLGLLSDFKKIKVKKVDVWGAIQPYSWISKGRFITAFSEPEPGHKNDLGDKEYYKDIGAHPRGRWESSNKKVGEVHKVVLVDKRLTAVYEGKQSGTTEIWYELHSKACTHACTCGKQIKKSRRVKIFQEIGGEWWK